MSKTPRDNVLTFMKILNNSKFSGEATGQSIEYCKNNLGLLLINKAFSRSNFKINNLIYAIEMLYWMLEDGQVF